ANTILWLLWSLLTTRSSTLPVFSRPAVRSCQPTPCLPTSTWCQPYPKRSQKNHRNVYYSSASIQMALTSLCPLPLTLPTWRHRLECLYICLFIGLIKHQANLLHTSIEKRLHLIATLLGLANNGYCIHHLICHELRRAVALTRLVSVSDAVCFS